MNISSILNVLTTPPSNFIYHIIIAFISVITLQLSFWLMPQGNRKNRLLLGLLIIIFAQIFLFVTNGIFNNTTNSILLANLDRAFLAIFLIWTMWLWAFPKKNKLGNILLIVFNLLTLVFLITFSFLSTTLAINTFNGSLLDIGWELFLGAVVLTAMVMLFRTKNKNWEYGLGFFVLHLIGLGLHFVYLNAHPSLSGGIRLAQLIAIPLMPAVIIGAKTPEKKPELVAPANLEGYPSVERRRFSTDQETFNTWLSAIKEDVPLQTAIQLTHAIAQSMRVDICLLTNAPEEFGDVSILCGYDVVHDQAIKGDTIAKEKVSILSNAILKGQPFWFSPKNAPLSSDMASIKNFLSISSLDYMLVIPLKHDGQSLGSILLMSPFSERDWNDEDFDYISGSSEMIGEIINKAFNQAKSNNELKSYQQQLNRAQDEIQALSKENTTLEKRLGEISEAKDTFSAAYQMEQLTKLQEESDETIDQLRADIERLETELLEKTTEEEGAKSQAHLQVEEELKLTLEEVARLQTEVTDHKVKIMTYEQIDQEAKGVSEEEQEVIQSIVQEIRQPMSSILGYTDLILGESVGELGGLQRKFLEKIKASNEKMRSLLDDLVHVSTFDANKFEISRENINLSEIIDEAISATSAQLQEKDISLQIEMPDELPALRVDKDAIQKVLTHLLENAGAATPNEGEITLHIKTENNEYDEEYLMMVVEDTGGGVPEDLVTKVFSRRYKAENPLIPGLGDTGVSLSIAKTLVEAHHGRIWVETTPDIGTQFSVLIPLDPKVN